MPRAPLVFCAIAFASAALLGFLRFQSENARQLAEHQLAAEAARATLLAADLAASREQNVALKAKLGSVDAELANSQAALAAAQSRTTQLDRELLQAKATLAVHETNARALAGELSAVRQDLADIRATHASPATVAEYRGTIAQLERQLAAIVAPAARGNSAESARSHADESTATLTNRAGRATVVSVGPQSAFVVLDFGAERGAHIGQKLDVNQGTLPIATVLISDVRPNFSIAQVLPDSLRGVLQRGDPAILLRTP